MSKRVFSIRRLQSIILAAAISLASFTTTFTVSEPITAEASYDNIRNALTENERKIFDAYEYLDDRIISSGIEITAQNKADFDTTSFYTIYSGADQRVTFQDNELRYARRAYIYDNPLKLAGAMAQMKFLYLRSTQTNKYSCFAYLQRTSDNTYEDETEKLKSTIKKLVKNIDDDQSALIIELQCFETILNNTTNSNIAIDGRDLKNTAYGALCMHRASSQGYALAFSLLLDEFDISNNILFNGSKCWNQVKIGTKWYETDIIGCDNYKKGVISYTKFNTSQSKIRSSGLRRADYCTRFRESTGTHSETVSKLNKYDSEVFMTASNYGFGILNSDGTITRTTTLSSEITVNLVPVFIEGSNLYDCNNILKNVVITSNPEESYYSWIGWSKDHQYIELSKMGPGTNQTLNAIFYYNDGSKTGKALNVSFTIKDKDDTQGNFLYKITGKNTVSLKKVKDKSLKTVTIPATVAIDGVDYKVTKIEDGAFRLNRKLETVILGENLKSIGKNCFSEKSNLVRVEIKGKNLSKFGKGAFKSANSNTIFVINAKGYSSYKKLVEKIKKVGGKKSVYRYKKG